jgi:hypothetical protein
MSNFDLPYSNLEDHKIEDYKGPAHVDPNALLERAVDPHTKEQIPVQRLMARHEAGHLPVDRSEIAAIGSFAQLVGAELNTVDILADRHKLSNNKAQHISKEAIFGHLRHNRPSPQQRVYESAPQQNSGTSPERHGQPPVLRPEERANMPELPKATATPPPIPGETAELEKKIARLEALVNFDMAFSVDFKSKSTESSGINNFNTLISLLKISLQNSDKEVKIILNED